jgi:hypothetical protein
MATKFLISLLSRIVPLTVAFFFVVYSDSTVAKEVAYVCGIGVLILAEYFGIYRPLVNLEEYKRKLLDHYYGDFIKTAAIGNEKITVRINIMIARWNWFGLHFFQYYQNGMAGHSDANLHFHIKKGFCGKVFREKSHEVRFVDLTKMKKKTQKNTFGFSDKEIEITDNIKAIVCIPLFRQVKTIRGNPNTKFFGVLNVDTLQDKGVEFLKSPQIQKQIKGLAACAQLILV